MHRLLERLDGLGGTLVPLSYLVGLLLGTMAYFAGFTSGSIVAVAVGLAVGSEVHAFLQQRRARASFAEYQRLSAAGDAAAVAAQKHFRAQVAILSLLVAFQCFTATAYAASNWHPAAGMPAWLQIGIRGCIIPVLFLLSGFLIPLHESPGAVLSSASQDILHYAVNRNVRHWRKRIRTVHRKGGDLSRLMVALLTEEGEASAARRTSLIAANLQDAEQHLPRRAGVLARLRGEPTSVVGALLAPATENVATEELARLTMQNGIAPLGERVTWVSDEEPPQTPMGVTRKTSKRRSDSGHSPMDSAAKKAQLHSMLLADPALSITEIQRTIQVARPTAVKYRDEIRRALWQQFPKRRAEFRTAWGESWAESV